MFIAPYFDYVSGGLLGAGTPTGDKLGSVTDGWILDFENGKILVRDTVTEANAVYDDIENEVSGWGSGFYYENSAGNYAAASGFDECYFGGTNGGYWFWDNIVNDCLYCRDWTQAGSWPASNMSTALDATGIDGSANTATTLTADAANATILQTITHASQDTTFSVWMRRVTGTGSIYITADGDGGGSETEKTITGSWALYYINVAALTNPVVGVKIATSGDVIEVDFSKSQLDSFTHPGPPVLTTSSSASITSVNLVMPTVTFDAAELTIVNELYMQDATKGEKTFQEVQADGSNFIVHRLSSGGDRPLQWARKTTDNLHYGTNDSIVADQWETVGYSIKQDSSVLSLNGATNGTEDTTGVDMPDMSSYASHKIGRQVNNSNKATGFIRHIICLPTYNNQTALNTLTS